MNGRCQSVEWTPKKRGSSRFVGNMNTSVSLDYPLHLHNITITRQTNPGKDKSRATVFIDLMANGSAHW